MPQKLYEGLPPRFIPLKISGFLLFSGVKKGQIIGLKGSFFGHCKVAWKEKWTDFPLDEKDWRQIC